MHLTAKASIVNSSPDAIFAKDLEGKYILFNESASSIVGVAKEEVLGNTDSIIFPEDIAQKIQKNDEDIVAKKSINTLEEELTTNCGIKKNFLVTKGPLFTESGEIFGIFGISRDITMQKDGKPVTGEPHHCLTGLPGEGVRNEIP